MARGRRTPGEKRRRWLLGGIVAAIILDVVLVGVAVAGGAGARDEGRLVASTPGTTPSGSAAPSAAPEATPSPTAIAASIGEVPTRLLSVVDDETAYRATVAACSATPAVLEKTTDGGATWTSSPVVADDGLSSLLRLNAVDSAQVDMVGWTPTSCAVGFTATYTSGLAFGDYPDRLAGAWYRSPTAPNAVHAPGTTTEVTVPCDLVLSVAANGFTGASVLCGDGSVLTTADGGATWATLAVVPGASDVTIADGATQVARVGQASCAGVEVSTSPVDADPGDALTAVCVPVTATVGSDVAISARSQDVWVWVDGATVRSLDGGATWLD